MALSYNILYDPESCTELIFESIQPGIVRKYPCDVITYRRHSDLKDIPYMISPGMREVSFQITATAFQLYERTLDYLRRLERPLLLFMGSSDFASEFIIKDVQATEDERTMQVFTISGVCYGVEGQMRLTKDSDCVGEAATYADADAIGGYASPLTSVGHDNIYFPASSGVAYMNPGRYYMIVRAKAASAVSACLNLGLQDSDAAMNFSSTVLPTVAGGYRYYIADGSATLNNMNHTILPYAHNDKPASTAIYVDLLAYVQASGNINIASIPDAPTPITVTYNPTADNRMRAATPTTVYATDTYLDIGNNGTTSFRPILMFDLSAIPATATINSAVLSLYWYHPPGATRTSDTVMQLFRPAAAWNSAYVCWTNRISATAWANAGGSWYDAAGVSQGSTPFSSVTFPAATVPDNAFHDWDVTSLVQKYVEGSYANTGFMFKASVESGNYIAFYSNDYATAGMRPKLVITYTEAA